MTGGVAARALRVAAATTAALTLLLACSGGSRGAVAPQASTSAASAGHVRHYAISADEVVWDYAPLGRNGITGRAFTAEQSLYAVRTPSTIGGRYRKCVYRAYSDASFRRLLPRPAADGYLGLLGPVLRAEVGDTIEVDFRNACSFATGMHPHGVRYAATSEGAGYDHGDGRTDIPGAAVPPGGRHTYTWEVPERAGPGPMDASSVMWMYHGHTDEISDTYAGLMGPIVVTARGRARADATPRDVDHELFLDFAIMNENRSPYLASNMRGMRKAPRPDAPEFVESNLKHAVNGYVFGAGPVPQLRRGERVRWYVMAMGSETDLHTPHWHGNTVTSAGMRADVLSLLPGQMAIADMTPDAAGTWLLHCHVADHIKAGMQLRYAVS